MPTEDVCLCVTLLYVCVCVCTQVSIHLCMYMCMCVCMHGYIGRYIITCTHSINTLTQFPFPKPGIADPPRSLGRHALCVHITSVELFSKTWPQKTYKSPRPLDAVSSLFQLSVRKGQETSMELVVDFIVARVCCRLCPLFKDRSPATTYMERSWYSRQLNTVLCV